MRQSNTLDRFQLFCRTLFADLNHSYWVLIRILVPALLVVKVLEVLGLTVLLGSMLEPLMSLVGLPGEFGLVWAAAMMTNLYTAMVVFYELSAGQDYTVAQISGLGCLVLVAHALPIEGAVAKVVGVPWRLTLVLRVGGAFLLAFLVHLIYRFSGLGLEPGELLWQPPRAEPGWLSWLIAQAKLLLSIYLILAMLMALMRLLRIIGVERWLHLGLRPLTKLLRVAPDAAQVTIIGLVLGLSFGAGLLIDASRKGQIAHRDMRIVVCFLGLCHSVIEDTLLILLLGADLWAILGARVVFALVVMALLVPALFGAAIKGDQEPDPRGS